MNIDLTFKSIRSIYQIVSGKMEADVSLFYRGTENGVSKPWHARVDAREANHETYEGALNALLDELRQELIKKAHSTEAEATRLKKAVAQLGN